MRILIKRLMLAPMCATTVAGSTPTSSLPGKSSVRTRLTHSLITGASTRYKFAVPVSRRLAHLVQFAAQLQIFRAVRQRARELTVRAGLRRQRLQFTHACQIGLRRGRELRTAVENVFVRRHQETAGSLFRCAAGKRQGSECDNQKHCVRAGHCHTAITRIWHRGDAGGLNFPWILRYGASIPVSDSPLSS